MGPAFLIQPTGKITRMHRYAPTPRQMLWGVLGAFVLLVVFVAIGYALTSIPSPNSIATRQATILYYSDGKTVLARLGETNRTDVTLKQVPSDVRHAVLSAEDRNFESEPGISPTGILRALWVDLTGGDVQGGSTITQQYVKNAYLTQARTFTRKFKEIFIAVKLGNNESKDQILTDYLNTIYFGRNAYGIEAASRAYFGKDVSKLDAAEGAVLAAVIRAPSYYDPAVNRSKAVDRWHYVIDGMVKEHWLTGAQASALRYPDAALKHGRSTAHNSDCVGPKFFICQAVKAELVRDGFDEARQAAGGYRVTTTIDQTAQKAASDAVAAHHGDYVAGGVDKGRESALVSVEPGNGAIRAMYGGGDGCLHPDRKDSCTDLTGVTGLYNPAGDYARSPGSSFKPYTLIAALQQGISLDSRFSGPPHIPFPGTNGKGISNSEGESCKSCTLTEALAKSINTIFVPLAQRVGPDKVAQAAKDAGIPARRIRPADEVPAITLGTSDVAPIDQAVAYATIAAQGIYAKPYLVATVRTSSGHRVFQAKKDTHRAFPADVMADTTYAMTQVLTNGTAAGRGLSGRPAAGKTGTNGERNGDKDAWFVGFTPQLSTAVWYGNADRNTFVTDNGAALYGSGLPALTWQQMMNAALAGDPVQSFPPAAHVGTAINPAPSSTSTPSATPSSSSTPTATATVQPTATATATTAPTPTQSSSPTPAATKTH
jgi:membrane peptidoglycan carboxypeptidase